MFRHRTVGLLAVSVGLSACMDERQPLMPPEESVRETPQQLIETITRSFAAALSRDGLRHDLLGAFQASPHRKHKVHFTRYLNSADGRGMVEAMAEEHGTTPSDILAMVNSLPPLEVYVPRVYDRGRWTGSADVVIAGTLATPDEFAAATSRTGFTTRGTPVAYDPTRGQPFVVVIIRIAGEDHAQPGIRLAPRLPAGPGAAISQPFEIVGMATDCDPQTAVIPCDDPSSGVETRSDVLASWVNWNSCTTAPSPDRDRDGFDDDCEYKVAFAVRPRLLFSYGDYTWSRETYWSVRQDDGLRTVAIFYLLGYHLDRGDPETGWTAHKGDSEFIIVRLYNSTGSRWSVRSVTLSAHWSTDSDDTTTRTTSGLSFYGDMQPKVWVADQKHANYPSDYACDNGGALDADGCNSPYMEQNVEMLPNRNIGNTADGVAINDCVDSQVGYSGRECFFQNRDFYGWQTRSGDGASPYIGSLHHYGFARGQTAGGDEDCTDPTQVIC